MEENIIKTKDVVKIYLIFTDRNKNQRKELVSLRCYDNRYYYFAGKSNINFTKPGLFAKADIIVYTKEGIYKANVGFKDVDFTLNEIIYVLNAPKKWEYIQNRSSIRKEAGQTIKVKFTDEVEIEAITYDISASGFSLITKHQPILVQQKFPCSIELYLPKDNLGNSEEKDVVSAVAKFARMTAITDSYEYMDYNLLAFKFINITKENADIIKMYLAKKY